MEEEAVVERAYKLNHNVSCAKHPSKTIEYFCKFPQCSERLSCSACLLKKQFCRHDINTNIVDIAEFMYEQKMAFEMRGLAKESDIHDYLVNKVSRRRMYEDIIDTEIMKFEEDINNMIATIAKTLEDLKQSIRSQLTEFKVSYDRTEQMLLKKVEDGFSTSYMSRFGSFEEVLQSKDYSSSLGLRELLEKLMFEGGSESKDIRKLYENLISMHDETPEIDYGRFDGIKSYFNVFESKIGQAGPLLITLHHSGTVASAKETNPNAVLEPLATVPPHAVKKIARSTSFPSNHTRTIYACCRLPERRLLTASDDGCLNLIDLATFEQVGSYQCHASGIRSMILLPNGRLVTGSYDKSIKIWPDPSKLEQLTPSPLQQSQVSTASKKTPAPLLLPPLKTLTGHTSSIIALRYLNDGASFASGSADYSIKVWDYERGENTKNFTGHMSDILCLECTATGNTLVSGSADRTLKVWSLSKKYSSACVKTMTGHLDFVWTIVLLQDNATVLSAGLDKAIKVWDITTGALLRNLPSDHTAHITKLLQYTKDVVLSCANDGSLKFWDFKTSLLLHSLALDVPLTTMLVTQDQSILAVGQDKTIYLCD